jgi:hypothetical protein
MEKRADRIESAAAPGPGTRKTAGQPRTPDIRRIEDAIAHAGIPQGNESARAAAANEYRTPDLLMEFQVRETGREPDGED